MTIFSVEADATVRRMEQARKQRLADPPKRFRKLVREIEKVARTRGARDLFREHIRKAVAERQQAQTAVTPLQKGLQRCNGVGRQLSRKYREADAADDAQALAAVRARMDRVGAERDRLRRDLRRAEAEARLASPNDTAEPTGPGRPLTLSEEYTYLAAFHDTFAPRRFERICPPEWQDGASDSAADSLAGMMYVVLARGFADPDLVPDDSPEIDALDDYLADVKADLAARGLNPPAGRKQWRRRPRRVKREPPIPTEEERNIAQYYEQSGKSQTEVADELNEALKAGRRPGSEGKRFPLTQKKVCEIIGKENARRRFNGQPEIETRRRARPKAMDGAKIEQGPRSHKGKGLAQGGKKKQRHPD